MDEMRENMRRMNHVDDLVHRTNYPFMTSVNSFPSPSKFKMSSLDSYDGTHDPCDHIATFKTTIHLQGIPDEIMCRAFPTILKGPARVWFSKIPPNTVGSFEELSKLFVNNFIGGQKHKCSSSSLLAIEQGENESLRSFITRFNREVLMQIKDDPLLRWQEKMKGDPNKCNKNKYCRFHRDYGHDMDECYDLHQQIENLIKQGKLRHFVGQDHKDKKLKGKVEEPSRPPLGEIRVIMGRTSTGHISKSRKT
ncbi:uncharacterized protein LOC142606329 [Castanea sativa]|uniref:uncharacterized protein LOC142606329 n=1 Tax=Castanea sativa TaxID=21020 RepID=UPI003F652F57